MRASLFLLVIIALAASSARGAVAVSVSLPDRNAVHRDFAAGVVDEARARFALLSPPLPAAEATDCGSDESCLTRLAGSTGPEIGCTHVIRRDTPLTDPCARPNPFVRCIQTVRIQVTPTCFRNTLAIVTLMLTFLTSWIHFKAIK